MDDVPTKKKVPPSFDFPWIFRMCSKPRTKVLDGFDRKYVEAGPMDVEADELSL